MDVNMDEFLAKTVCHNCGVTIAAGDDRIVAALVEINGIEAPEPGRADMYHSVFCRQCAADLPKFEFVNPWKVVSDALANPSAGAPSDDLQRTAVSLQGIAERRQNGQSKSLDDALGAILSSDERSDSRPPGEADLRRRVHDFLWSPKFESMPAELRQIALWWAHGWPQAQIASSLRLSPATVSRRLCQILDEFVNVNTAKS